MCIYMYMCVSIYIYIYSHAVLVRPAAGLRKTSKPRSLGLPRVSSSIATGVCEKGSPADKKTGWQFSFESTKSEAGSRCLPLACRAKAHLKGVRVSRYFK